VAHAEPGPAVVTAGAGAIAGSLPVAVTAPRAVALAEAAVITSGSGTVSGVRTILVAHTHAAPFRAADEQRDAQSQYRQYAGIQFNHCFLSLVSDVLRFGCCFGRPHRK